MTKKCVAPNAGRFKISSKTFRSIVPQRVKIISKGATKQSTVYHHHLHACTCCASTIFISTHSQNVFTEHDDVFKIHPSRNQYEIDHTTQALHMHVWCSQNSHNFDSTKQHNSPQYLNLLSYGSVRNPASSHAVGSF